MSNGENEFNRAIQRFKGFSSTKNLVNGNPGEFNPSNLAFQQSLKEFLDEFTEVISGELRYLGPEDQENKP